MLPLQITITPTMLTFKNLEDDVLIDSLQEVYGMKWNEKGYYFINGNAKMLYKVLLDLSYKYDIEIF